MQIFTRYIGQKRSQLFPSNFTDQKRQLRTQIRFERGTWQGRKPKIQRNIGFKYGSCINQCALNVSYNKCITKSISFKCPCGTSLAMKRLFAFSVHDVKAAEETLQQKGLERHWTGGGTLNCVLQNKMHKLETQKKHLKIHLDYEQSLFRVLRRAWLKKSVRSESLWMLRSFFSYFQATLYRLSKKGTTLLTKIFGRF